MKQNNIKQRLFVDSFQYMGILFYACTFNIDIRIGRPHAGLIFYHLVNDGLKNKINEKN